MTSVYLDLTRFCFSVLYALCIKKENNDKKNQKKNSNFLLSKLQNKFRKIPLLVVCYMTEFGDAR